MNDREMLELAAKAAGATQEEVWKAAGGHIELNGCHWNPSCEQPLRSGRR